MARKNPGATESRLMGWERAETACGEVWDFFVKTFNDLIDERIAQAANRIDEEHINSIPDPTHATADELRQCKQQFADLFPPGRKRALKKLEAKLCKNGGTRRVGPVCSRYPVPGTQKRGRPRKNDGRRKHVATGKPRGWNAAKGTPWPHRCGRMKIK